MKKALRLILCIPFFVLFILFDIVKFPYIILFSPIWLLMALIYALEGKKSYFLEFIFEGLTLGTRTAYKLYLGEIF